MVVARAIMCRRVPAPLRSAADDMIMVSHCCRHGYRGGAGRAMIGFASANCDCAGSAVVGTQVANIPSVRLYETLGFRLTAARYVFHYHGTTAC